MNDADRNKLRERIRGKISLNDAAFEPSWRSAFEDFSKWQSGSIGQSSSRLTAQLELLRRLCSTFPEARLRDDEQIIDLVVSDAKDVGDRLLVPSAESGQAMAKVVRREVSDRFGICYTLETPDGSRFTREFFD
jgi:hypothetical protein